MSDRLLRYQPAPTVQSYIKSDAFMDCIVGPIGSGKSAGSVVKLLRKAYKTTASVDGVRRSRFLIGRNTYRELKDTTIATFFQWIPQSAGIYSAGDFSFRMRARDVDGVPVESEFLFRSFQTAEDARKLLSLELTGFWFNEARELARPIIDAATGRVGRYPRRQDCPDGFWYGGMLDTNPSDRMHWLYKAYAEERAEGHALFKQPGGMDPDAENLDNLPRDYYKRISAGKLQDWIDVYVHGKWGFAREGMPVYQEFNDRTHVTAEPIPFDPERPLILGIDFGLTPAAAIFQARASGGMDWIGEVTTERAGALQFARALRPFIQTHYPGVQEIRAWGDPAGRQGAQTDEDTCFNVLANEGIEAFPAPTNVFSERAEATRHLLATICLDGLPGIRISPVCKFGVVGFGGGYRYRQVITAAAGVRYSDQVDKNHYSHICDAAGYAVIGEGHGVSLFNQRDSGRVDYSRTRRATARG